jgi:hypothetical protein
MHAWLPQSRHDEQAGASDTLPLADPLAAPPEAAPELPPPPELANTCLFDSSAPDPFAHRAARLNYYYDRERLPLRARSSATLFLEGVESWPPASPDINR